MRTQRVEPTGLSVTVPPVHSMADEDVVRRVLGGETALFEGIVRRYGPRLFRTVRAIVLGDAEAEQIVQEAFVRAYDRLAEFEGKARFSTWLMRIAIQRVLARPHDRNGAQDGGALPGTLERAIDGIPPTLRIVFVLRDIDGLATDETAECVGISPVNVRVRLHRARLHLRARFDGYEPSDMRQLHPFPADRGDRVWAGVFRHLRPL